MKLPNELVTIVCRGILKQLIARRIIFTENLNDTLSKMINIFKLDLDRDSHLTEKAKSIVDKELDKLKSKSNIDYRNFLLKVKKELAAKEKYILWVGDSKFPEEKIWQLSRDFTEFFKSDDKIEYFVKPEQLVKEIVFVFSAEALKDKKREERALNKVLSIKRNIKEGTSEFESLKDVFYRELLEKEA